MLARHVRSLLEWKSPGPSWHIPLLAAVCVAIPLVAGLVWREPRLGMLAATGAMVILYLPRDLGSVSSAMLRLIVCSFGFVACYAIGAGSTFHPAASVLALGLLTVAATAICRTNKILPPGSFFFILIASIACSTRFEPGMIPLRAGSVALGGLTSCIVAFIYYLLTLRRAWPAAGVGKTDPRLAAVLVESLVIAFFVALSLLVARLLRLDNPYWVPISAAAILQGGTFRAVWHRQIHRIAGTAVGMALFWFLLPLVSEPALMVAIIVVLVFAVESLVPRHYGLAVVFITPLTVTFAEFSAGGIPVHGLLTARLMDIVLGSVIGAAGGWVLHRPQWCLRLEQRINRLPWLAGSGQ